jgi:hypothetical protein
MPKKKATKGKKKWSTTPGFFNNKRNNGNGGPRNITPTVYPIRS